MDVPISELGRLFTQVQDLASSLGATIYNIQFRHQGVGIEWYEPAVQGPRQDWQTGLIIHGWHPSLPEALAQEAVRLLALARAKEITEGLALVKNALRG